MIILAVLCVNAFVILLVERPHILHVQCDSPRSRALWLMNINHCREALTLIRTYLFIDGGPISGRRRNGKLPLALAHGNFEMGNYP